MKHLYIVLLVALFAPIQAAKAETLSLETVIERALQNSPETARILNSVADTEAEAFEIETLEYNPENYWFEAQIVAPNKHNIHARQKIYGKIKPTIDVPVLKNTIRNGDVISRHDITTIKAPLHSINHDVYLKAQDLIGLTPRRLITAGSPIKEADVQEPRMVDRGDSVTIVYNSGPLRLTSTGRALQHGAKGDLVRVTNAQSKQTIDAIVSGDQEVTVETF